VERFPTGTDYARCSYRESQSISSSRVADGRSLGWFVNISDTGKFQCAVFQKYFSRRGHWLSDFAGFTWSSFTELILFRKFELLEQIQSFSHLPSFRQRPTLSAAMLRTLFTTTAQTPKLSWVMVLLMGSLL
jgi:hypothetical protein